MWRGCPMAPLASCGHRQPSCTLPPPPTRSQDSVVEGNFVEDHGAGFALDSYDQATFANVTFRGNVAAMQGGAGWCGSLNVTQIRGCRFEGNVAAQGGALFLEDPCR